MPRMKSCSYCGRIHQANYICQKKQARVKEPTEASRLRTCRRWDKTRKRVYERDHFLCRVCFRRGKFTSEALEAHHIQPLREAPELAYEDENIITLCQRHHKEADRGIISRDFLKDLVEAPFAL